MHNHNDNHSNTLPNGYVQLVHLLHMYVLSFSNLSAFNVF